MKGASIPAFCRPASAARFLSYNGLQGHGMDPHSNHSRLKLENEQSFNHYTLFHIYLFNVLSHHTNKINVKEGKF